MHMRTEDILNTQQILIRLMCLLEMPAATICAAVFLDFVVPLPACQRVTFESERSKKCLARLLEDLGTVVVKGTYPRLAVVIGRICASTPM